jgi:hypothetical protein
MTMPNPKAAVEKFFVGGACGTTGFLLAVTFFVTIQISTYFLAIIACIFSCIILAQNGWGKFQPINAPTATQSKISNITFSFKILR